MNRLLTPDELKASIAADLRKVDEIEELRACLRIAMKEWEEWLDECRGIAPSNPDWKRCLAALGEAWE